MKGILVITLAAIAAVFEAIAVVSACRELRDVRGHGDALRETLEGDPILRFLATSPDGINRMAFDAVITALKNQWTPSSRVMRAAYFWAPSSIAAGLAAAIVGVVV